MATNRRRVGRWIVVALVAGAGAWLLWALTARPSLQPYAEHRLPALAADARPEVAVTFLGVSTLLFDDGETAWITDGFFSRPGKRRTFLGHVAPNRPVIAAALQRLKADRLDGVVVLHSHFDHAMDAPEVARRTGAWVFGTPSTANVARGWQLPESHIRVVRGGDSVRLGRFVLRFVDAAHAPTWFTGGTIDEPLVPPQRATAYKEGGCFSLLVQHDGGTTMLVHASAGVVPGALANARADVVFLGVAGLAGRTRADRDAYWRETVQAVGARRVVAIHWDDFTRPLHQPLQPLPRLFDDFDVAFDFLLARGQATRVDVRWADAWQRFDPTADLDLP